MLIAFACGLAVAGLGTRALDHGPHAAWEDARRGAHRAYVAIEEAIGRAAKRGADYVDQGAQGSEITGRARIVDGDTLEVRGRRIRLHGIDAPEAAQSCRSKGRRWPCGREATQALSRRIASRTVTCEERDRDRYGRIVALCRAGDEDVNAWMVTRGWAFAYRRYSIAYVAHELAARAANRGIWRGDVVAPWEWRKGARLPTR